MGEILEPIEQFATVDVVTSISSKSVFLHSFYTEPYGFQII